MSNKKKAKSPKATKEQVRPKRADSVDVKHNHPTYKYFSGK